MATRNSKNDNNQTQRKSQRDQNSEVPFSIASISSITNILGHHRRRRTSSSSTGIDAQLDIHRIEQARAGEQRLPGIPGDQQPDGYRLSVIQDRSGAVSDRWRHRPPLLDRSRAAQAQKKSVKLFDIDGIACDKIGSLLINDVMECKADGNAVDNCLQHLTTSTLTNVKLSK